MQAERHQHRILPGVRDRILVLRRLKETGIREDDSTLPAHTATRPGPDRADPATSTRARRVGGTLFGLSFIALAVLVIATSVPSNRPGAILVAAVIGGLGVDLVASMVRRRRSLLSRIGPLQ